MERGCVCGVLGNGTYTLLPAGAGPQEPCTVSLLLSAQKVPEEGPEGPGRSWEVCNG